MPQPELTREEIDGRIARIHEAHDGYADPNVLLDEAEGHAINADALFADGFPDKAEAAGLRAQKLSAEANFLTEHAGVDRPDPIA